MVDTAQIVNCGLQVTARRHDDPLAAKLWEIADNLHRCDLTKEQRDQHIRRYAELLEARIVPQTAPVLQRGRGQPKGIARQIADETGLSKDTIRRALFTSHAPRIILPGSESGGGGEAMRLIVPICVVLTLTTWPARAQSPAGGVAPLVIGSQQQGMFLPEGTPIPLRTLQQLSSQTSRVGDRFDLEVTDDIHLNGRTVIPAGTKAAGEVTRAEKKGMFGKSGKLETRVLYIKLGDRQLRVRGSKDDKGSSGTAATVATLLFVWPAAFFVTGKSAVLPPGTTTTTYLEQNLPLVFADSPPASPIAAAVTSAPLAASPQAGTPKAP